MSYAAAAAKGPRQTAEEVWVPFSLSLSILQTSLIPEALFYSFEDMRFILQSFLLPLITSTEESPRTSRDRIL
jgi:hypothetical protein